MTLIQSQQAAIYETTTPYDRHKEIVSLRNQIVNTFLDLGKALYWFEFNKDYEVLGHASFNAYLADPDVDISRSMAYRLKRVYETFILGLAARPVELVEAGPDKLDLIIPYINAENADEWINKAAALSRSDLRKEIREQFLELPGWDEQAAQKTIVSMMQDYMQQGTDNDWLSAVSEFLYQVGVVSNDWSE